MSQQENTNSENPLLNAPVNKMLLLMSAPISLGMLSTFLFQLVDTYFIGKLGSQPLAALGFAAGVYMLLVGLFMGMAVGVSSLVAGALGKEELHLARRYTTISLVLSTIIAIGLSALGILFLEPLFLGLGAEAKLIPMIREYMNVLYLGMPLLIFGLIGASAIRATGDVKPPEIVMGIAGIINVVFDALLIFGVGPFPKLGIQGAALATVLSWVFVFVMTIVLLMKHKLLTTQSGALKTELKELARLSIPATLTQILLPITAMFVTFLVARSGPEAVAAYGVVMRIETLMLVGISSMSIAIVPFIAQNLAQKERVNEAIAMAGKTSFYWGGGLFIVLVLLAEPIASIFTTDPKVLDFTKLYFYIVAFTYVGYGIITMTASIFNGLQMPSDALKVLTVKTFAFTIPLALAGSYFGALGVFGGIALSNLLGYLTSSRHMRKFLIKSESEITNQEILEDYISDWKALIARVKGNKGTV